MSDIVIRGEGGIGGGGTKKPRTPINTADSAYLKSVNLATMQFLLCEGPIHGPAEGNSWPGLLASTYLDDTSLLVRGYGGTVPVEDLVLSYGYPDQSPVPGYGTIWNTLSVSQAVKASFPVFSTITPSDPTTPHRARVMLTWDALVLAIKENGDVLNAAVPYLIDYTDALGNIRLVFAGFVYGKFSGPFQREHEWDLAGPGPWTVRVVRMAADDEQLETPIATFRSSFSWSSVSVGPVITLNYKYSATLSLAARADRYSQLPSVAIDLLGKICLVPSNYDSWSGIYYGQWNGTFKTDWTDNPAWCFYDMVTNGRYGLGESIEPALIDKWSLYQIGQYCDGLVPAFGGGMERRFRCNILYTTQDDAWTVLQQLASIFRGMVYWSAGIVVSIQDRPGPFVYTFNPANTTQVVDDSGEVTEPCFEYQGTAKRTRHTVCLVSWDDPSNNYQPRVEYVADSEGLARLGYRPLELRLPGVTSKGQALRVAQWSLLAEILLDETITFGVGAVGSVLRPGDLIKVADPDKAAVRYGGRVVAVNGDVVTLDAAPTPTQPSWYGGLLLSWQSVDAAGQPALETATVVGVAGADLTVQWRNASRPGVREPWLIEVPDRTAQPFRVMGVEEEGPLSYRLTALRYRADIFDRVDFDTPLSDDEDYLFKLLDPAPPTITQAAATWGDGQVKLHITWTPADQQIILEGFDLSVSYYRLQYRQGELQADGTIAWPEQWREVERQADTSEYIPVDGYVVTSRYQVRMASVSRLGHDSNWSPIVDVVPIEQWLPMPDFAALVPDATGALVKAGELTHSNLPSGGHRWAWAIQGQLPSYARALEVQGRPSEGPNGGLYEGGPMGPGAPRRAPGGRLDAATIGPADADGWFVLGTAPPDGTLSDVLPWPAHWEIRARLLTFIPGLAGTSWMTDRIDRQEIVPPVPVHFTVVTTTELSSAATTRRFSWEVPLSPFPAWGSPALVSDITGYEVRFKRGRSVVWELGLPLYSDGLTGDQQWFDTTLFNFGLWVIMLRSRDRTGWLSDQLVAVTVNLGDPLLSNVVERVDLGEGFPGELVNLQREEHTSGLMYPVPTSSAFYELPLDDEIYDGSDGWRLVQIDPLQESLYLAPFSVQSDGTGLVIYGPGTATVQWFIKADTTSSELRYPEPVDQPMYDTPTSGYFYIAAPEMGGEFHPWAPFEKLSIGNYILAGRIVSPDGVKPGTINDLDLVLDVPDVLVNFEDVWVEPGATTFEIDPPLRLLKAVNVTLQADPGADAVLVLVDQKTRSRFRLRAYRADGAPGRALVDCLCQGC